MEISKIASQNGFVSAQFQLWLKNNNYPIVKKGLLKGEEIPDSDVARAVQGYRAYQSEQMSIRQAELAAAEAEAAKKQAALARMLISSGFSFDGYRITRYSGYISGDDCTTMKRDDFFGNNKVADNLCDCLVKIRRQALKELKEAAYDLGCNAVIGVDFDYLVMDPQHAAALNAQVTVYEPYVICVTANGNAVFIEKDE